MQVLFHSVLVFVELVCLLLLLLVLRCLLYRHHSKRYLITCLALLLHLLASHSTQSTRSPLNRLLFSITQYKQFFSSRNVLCAFV